MTFIYIHADSLIYNFLALVAYTHTFRAMLIGSNGLSIFLKILNLRLANENK